MTEQDKLLPYRCPTCYTGYQSQMSVDYCCPEREDTRGYD